MSNPVLELITMADIARLTGQSRAAVGNWKARNPDFPTERDRGPRGPLYDRAEVIDWLQSTGRLKTSATEVSSGWRLMQQLRGAMAVDDALPWLLALLAIRTCASPEDWRELRTTPPEKLESALLRRLVTIGIGPIARDFIEPGRAPAVALTHVVPMVSSIDRAEIPNVADELLERFAEETGKRGGEHLSPPSVRRLMTLIADPAGCVYDPAAGIGQLLIDAAANAGTAIRELLGQERVAYTWVLAQLNLVIHDVRAEIALGDVLRDDQFADLRADRVIAIPPFGQKGVSSEVEMVGDPRWVWGEPGPNDGDWAWIQHCLFHLADGGRATLVLPNGVLYRQGRPGRIRQRIIKAGLLDAVIALPPGLFHSTSIPTSLLVFAKGRRTANGEPAPTLMLDTRNSPLGREGRSTSLPDDLISEVSRIYHEWTAGQTPKSELASVAYFDDLAANDFIIDPARYVMVPRLARDADEVAAERSALLRKLENLNRVSRDADSRLQMILKGLR